LFFQGKRALQEGFLAATAVANFHSRPSQEEGQMLTKGALYVKAMLGDLTVK